MSICCYCQKNEATRSYERIGKGGKTVEYYCLSCYEQRFLCLDEASDEQPLSACPYCGTTVEEFQKRKIVGCSHCYQALSAEILPVVVKMQYGVCGHRGKKPPMSPEDEAAYEQMKSSVGAEQDDFRGPRERQERFSRQKKEMERLVAFWESDPTRQQEYKDKLERMERKGLTEEEIVW